MYQYNKTIRKTTNYDAVTKENINKHNLNWPIISHHPYRILIIGGSGSRKTNALLNLIIQEDDDYSIIDQNLYVTIFICYLYVTDQN